MSENIYDQINNYSSKSSIERNMLEIAKKYWKLPEISQYKSGLFGHVLESISTITEDTHNSINVIRQEFYPQLAEFTDSLYKHAALQQVDIPMAKPAEVDVVLLLTQNDIITKGTVDGDNIKFILDDSLIARIDNLNFALDYPITILAKKLGNLNKYSFTVHYDINYINNLNQTTEKYIPNKLIYQGGEYILLLNIKMKQVVKTILQEPLIKSTSIETTHVDFQYTGKLSNIEIFYQANDNSQIIQLTKQIDGSKPIKQPFCNYKLIGNNIIRIIFPYNVYFMPSFNSRITIYIYTTEGSNGNFTKFDGDVICTAKSDKYPYNNDIFIVGRAIGSSTGGLDSNGKEDFRRDIMAAYTTNRTIVSDNDLQVLFNSQKTTNNNISFSKKRDDCLYRQHSAFMLMKDEAADIIPTNTVDVHINSDKFDIYYEYTKRLILKPGSIFEYRDNEYYVIPNEKGIKLKDDLDKYELTDNLFLFTNPLLISTTLYPNAIGYYLNSVNHTISLDYSTVNDSSNIQFLASPLLINRNAIMGEDYYKFSITISPSNVSSISFDEIVDATITENSIIRARNDGEVIDIKTINNCPILTIKYIDDSIENIELGNYIYKENNEYKYHTGFNSSLEIGDKVLKNELIATKYDSDLGKIRVIGFLTSMREKGAYIPFSLEKFNESYKSFTFSAYIKTDDFISLKEEMNLLTGICTSNGNQYSGEYIIPICNLFMDICVFFKDNDKNYPHIFSSYDFVKEYTHTNTYTPLNNGLFNLISPIRYIRSVLSFADNGENNKIISMKIKECPMIKSNWIKNRNNAEYFYRLLMLDYEFIQNIFVTLQSTFTIDLKFFNTYGKSKFYKVGIKNEFVALNKVNCTFSFGIKLNSLTSTDTFKDKFITYVRNYIENLNDTTKISNSIYIMNLISDIKNYFDEIEYLEYYGLNNYDKSVQKIESINQQELKGYSDSYIPEFINIYTVQDKNKNYPKIDILFL